MISFTSLLEIINVVHFAKAEGRKANIHGRVADPNIFQQIAASVADVTVNTNGIKKILVSSLSTIFIKSNPDFSNGFKSLSRNLLDCHILWNGAFNNFILAEESFAKALQRFEICVLLIKNLCGKCFSSLESRTIFDESFKVTSVLIFIPDLNLFSCELENFTFKVLY